MADLPEVSEFKDGVRAFEPTDPVRYDILNNTIQPLVNRTRWLRENIGQGGGGIDEAPEDGSPYVRQDAQWVEAPQQGVEDAPEDGSPYVRQDAQWVEAPRQGIEDAPEDDTTYARKNSEWVPVQQGGGGGPSPNPGFSPVEWVDGQGTFPEMPEGQLIPVGLLEPGKHYILSSRSDFVNVILAHSDDEIEEIQSLFECMTGDSLDLKEIPVGAEFHFTLAGDPDATIMNSWGYEEDVS